MSSDFGRMLAVGAIRFEDRAALAERVGQEEVGGCTPLANSAHGRPWKVTIAFPVNSLRLLKS